MQKLVLPSGKEVWIDGIPEGVSKVQVQQKLVSSGQATMQDFETQQLTDMVNMAGGTVEEVPANAIPPGTPQLTPEILANSMMQNNGINPAPVSGALPAFPNAEQNKWLQEQYGDESTIFNSTNPRNREPRYDRKELSKRYYKDQLGFEPKPTDNPFVHMGKTVSDLGFGAHQIAGALPFVDGPSQEDYNNWQQENMLYAAADQPLWSQLLGDVMLGGANIIAAPGKALLAQGIKKFGATKAGSKIAPNAVRTSEQMLGNAAYTGTTVPTSLTPGLTGGIEGAAFMGAQPVDPSLPIEQQIGQRLTGAALGGGLGFLGDIAGRQLSNKAQKGITDSLKKEAQGSLPLPVELPTPALYGNMAGLRELQGVAGGRAGAAQGSAQMQMENLRQSLLDNFQQMNISSSGSSNEQIGHSMRNVLDEYKNRWQASKDVMDAAYSKTKGTSSIVGDAVDYKRFLNYLEKELSDEGMPLVKGAKSAFNELKRIDSKKTVDGKMELYDARKLMSRYKALNSVLRTAKKGQKPAIERMKTRLMDFMQQRQFWGNAEDLRAFKDATDTAAAHYNKFHGDKTVDKYLEGEYTPADVSKRIFSGEALDYTEAPKAAALDKILNAVPESRIPLRNEVFANFTDEIGRGKVEKAIPKMQQRVLSGSEEGVFGRVFDPEHIQQFKDLRLAIDKINIPKDLGRTADQGMLLKDLSSILPQGWMPGTRGLNDFIKTRRSEKGRISAGGDFGKAAYKPVLYAMDQQEKERQAEEEWEKLLRELFQNNPMQN